MKHVSTKEIFPGTNVEFYKILICTAVFISTGCHENIGTNVEGGRVHYNKKKKFYMK